MSDDLLVDIHADTQQNDNQISANLAITTHAIPTTTSTPEDLTTQDKSTDQPAGKKDKGKKKKDKEEKDKKKKEKVDADDDLASNLLNEHINEDDSDRDDHDDADKADDHENTHKEKGEKGKKKKNKDKANLDPSSQTIEYVSTSGHHYELIKVQPKGKYDVKMHMTNERTFFKYLFASFHLGAMGTFLLQYYSQPSFYKPVLIGFIWLTAFSFICVGLYTYYQRRQFLQQGKMKQLEGLQIHGPTYILSFFFLVFVTILLYSVDKIPSKTKLQVRGPGTSSSEYTQHQSNTPTPFTTLLPVG